MLRRAPIRPLLALASALWLLSAAGCSSGDSAPSAAGGGAAAGAAGAGAGAAAAGSSGAGGGAGAAAGAGGRAGSGGAAGHGGGKGGSGGGGGGAGKGGAGGSGGTGGAGGAVAPPTSCAEAHGAFGCCLQNVAYYSIDGVTLATEDCNAASAGGAGGSAQVCAWNAKNKNYGCVAAAQAILADPSGAAPPGCGGPPVAGAMCGASAGGAGGQGGSGTCATSADCTGVAGMPRCNAALMLCVACLTSADCPGAAPVCATDANTCGPCLADSDCSAASPVCAASGACVAACKTNADCGATPAAPVCDASAGRCVGCLVRSDCAGAAPACDPLAKRCVGCLGDADCAAPSPFCALGSPGAPGFQSCVACRTSYDCHDKAAPVCTTLAGHPSCGAPSGKCATDDALEPNGGPAAAVDITPTSGDAADFQNLQICDVTVDVYDWFKFTAADGDDVTLTVRWKDPQSQLGLLVADAGHNALGYSYHQSPALAALTYLPAGTYYARVFRDNPESAGTSAVSTSYELSVARTRGNACQSGADCAGAHLNQRHRSVCDGGSHACRFAGAQQTLADGSPCDHAGDCVAGEGCNYTLFQSHADALARCGAVCATDADCAGGQVCNLITSVCGAKCASDQDCGVPEVPLAPAPGQPWVYGACVQGTCNVAAGAGGAGGAGGSGGAGGA